MLEALAVGVHLKLTDNVAARLGFISRQFIKTGKEARALQAEIDKIKFKAVAGGIGIGLGAMGLYMLKPALEQAKLLQEAQARFATFGMGNRANNDALMFAKNMNIVGSSYVDNMNLMTEAQGVFRESGKLTLAEQLRGAKLAAPLLAKIAFSQAALGRKLPGGDDASAAAMLRFVEMRGGLQSPEAFNRIANLGFKAVQSSGGNVTWELLRQFMATGSTAAQGLTDKALFGQFEPLIGELKGKAGTDWMTAYNRLEGIVRVNNPVAHLLVDSGLWRKDDIVWNSQGGIKRFRDNKSPLTQSRQFEQTPALWYQQTMLPLYQKMGLDQAGRLRENALVFGRGGGQMFNLIDRQLQAILNSVSAQDRAKDINQTYALGKNTALGQQIEMRKHLNDLEASAGAAILPLMVSGLKTLNPMLWALSDWAKRHPGQVRTVVLAWAGLSSALLTLGSAAVIGAGIQGIQTLTRVIRGRAGIEGAAEAAAASVNGRGGLINSLFGLRSAMLTGALAADAAYWIYTHPSRGTFDKGHAGDMRHWTPDWVKKSGMDKPMTQVMGIDAMAAAISKALHGAAVQLDGKKVGQIVSMHQGKEAAGPSTGPSRPDPRMSPMLPSGSY